MNSDQIYINNKEIVKIRNGDEGPKNLQIMTHKLISSKNDLEYTSTTLSISNVANLTRSKLINKVDLEYLFNTKNK